MPELSKELYKVHPMIDRCAIAHMWLSCGFGLLPCQPDTKRLVQGFGPVRGVIDSPDLINYWFRDRNCNLAIVTVSCAVILDFDKIEIYDQFAAAWPDLAKSYTEATPRGGRHLFLILWEGAKSLIIPGLVQGLEVKNFCVAYPSVVGGKPYEVLEPGRIVSVSMETVKAALQPFFVPGQSNQPSPAAPVLGRLDASGGVNNGLRQNRGIMARVKAAWPIREYLTYFEPRLKSRAGGNGWRRFVPGMMTITLACG